MAAESKKRFQIVFSEEDQTVSIKNDLPPDDLEIRWFKETDCVCFYKKKMLIKGRNYENTDLPIENLERGNIPLKDISESDGCHYLFQLTDEVTTEEITLCFQQTGKTQQLTKQWKQADNKWTDKERIKMANSALWTVFSTLEKRDHQDTILKMQINTPAENELDEKENLENQQPGRSEKSDRSATEKRKVHKDLQDNNALVLKPNIEVETLNEEKDSRREDTSTEDSEDTLAMETSTSQENKKENLGNPQLACSEIDKGLQDNNAPVLPANIKVNTQNKEKDSRQEDTSTEESEDTLAMETSTSQENKKENLGNPQLACTEIHKGLQDNNAPVLLANIKVNTQNKEKDSRREDTSMHDSENSTSQLDEKENLDNPQLACLDKLQTQLSDRPHANDETSQPVTKKHKKEKEGVSVFTILAGKTNDCHKKFIADLQNRIENLREVCSVEESDIVLLFCPIVSRAGTDIDAALTKISYPADSKLTVLVVLHHTYDPEKTISDSSKYVNIENLLTVDCLFYEDKELLKCQRNLTALDKSVDWFISKAHKIGVTVSLINNVQTPPTGSTRKNRFMIDQRRGAELEKRHGHNVLTPPTGSTRNNRVTIDQRQGAELVKHHEGIKVFSVLAGKTNNIHTKFIELLKSRIEDLKEVRTVDESDIVLIFCPIVSKAGSDIDAALRRCYTNDSKLTVLVVLHHTFDREKTVLDSSKCVSRKEILTVDCLFYEDEGLLKCPRNSAAYDKSVDWLIQQGNKIGLKIYPKQNKSPNIPSRRFFWSSTR